MIVRERSDLSGMHCSASFSPCDRYRYLLTWRWSDAPLLVAWMLNPSTATHEKLDPTIAGLVARARAWGHGGVRVINLFAWRDTNPAAMKRAADPIGPENSAVTLDTLATAARDGATVICGWGAHGRHCDRAQAAPELAQRAGAQLHCLATNQDGSPKHPLYIAHSVVPRPWTASAPRPAPTITIPIERPQERQPSPHSRQHDHHGRVRCEHQGEARPHQQHSAEPILRTDERDVPALTGASQHDGYL